MNVTEWLPDDGGNNQLHIPALTIDPTPCGGVTPVLDIQAVGYSYSTVEIDAIADGVVTVSGLSRPGNGFTPRVRALRSPELLDDMGSFWVAADTLTIYMIPPAGEGIGEVRLATTYYGIEAMEGVGAFRVENFALSCYRLHGVRLNHGEPTIEDCAVTGVGANGVHVEQFNDSHTVVNPILRRLTVRSVGENGIFCGVGDRRNLATTMVDAESGFGINALVESCDVSAWALKKSHNYRGISLAGEDPGNWAGDYAGNRLYGYRCMARRNHVHDGIAIGIFAGGLSQIIDSNLVARVCTRQADAGGIYGAGANPTNGAHRIVWNRVVETADVSGYELTNPFTFCVYLDDLCSYNLVEGNEFAGFTYGGFSNQGRGNMWRNNKIAMSAESRFAFRTQGNIIADVNAAPYEEESATSVYSIPSRQADLNPATFVAATFAEIGVGDPSSLNPASKAWRLPIQHFIGNDVQLFGQELAESCELLYNVTNGVFGTSETGYWNALSAWSTGAASTVVPPVVEDPPTGVPSTR